MENLLKNWKNSQEQVKVRHQRRMKMCQALSVCGSLFLLVSGVLAFTTEQSYILGSVLFIVMCVALTNAYLLKVKGNLEQSVFILNWLIYILVVTLLYTGGINNTGILWVYPLVAVSLFINKFWLAVRLTGLYTILLALIVLTPVVELIPADYPPVIAFRFILSLFALSVICLIALYSEENVYELLIKLHNDDTRRLAFHDSLTGLSNRWSFQQNLQEIIQQENKEQSYALLYIDLDNFKFVNDNYGHDVGDRLLIHLSNELSDTLAEHELARLAGDEFTVILNNIDSQLEAEVVAKRILNLFQGGYSVDGIVYPVFVSIGIALNCKEISSPSQLLRCADAAMYKAKKKGNNNYQFFDEEIANDLLEQQVIETGLQGAIESQEFSLLYHPIFDAKTREIVAVEALLRCHNPGLAGYGPDKFIPAAESTGLIKELDEWVFENAIKDFSAVRETTGFTGQLAINISGLELLDERFPQKIKHIADKYKLPTSVLDLEVTETALVPDNPIVIKVLNELRHEGFSLSLDDFGTGYTSFNQLILYPADTLKIDRSFTNDLFSDDKSRSNVVQTIHELARIYKLRVIAEGVDTEEQLSYLQKLGCDWIQGYYLSPPIAKNEFISLINKVNKT